MSDDFSTQVQNELYETLRKILLPENINKIAEEAIRIIRKRTKLGYESTGQESEKEKLYPLSESYKKQRKRTGTHSSTTISKSNLTLTGEMLDSIKYFVTDQVVNIGFDSGSFAEDKATWVTKGSKNFSGGSYTNARPFLNLSKSEVKQLEIFIRNLLNVV